MTFYGCWTRVSLSRECLCFFPPPLLLSPLPVPPFHPSPLPVPPFHPSALPPCIMARRLLQFTRHILWFILLLRSSNSRCEWSMSKCWKQMKTKKQWRLCGCFFFYVTRTKETLPGNHDAVHLAVMSLVTWQRRHHYLTIMTPATWQLRHHRLMITTPFTWQSRHPRPDDHNIHVLTIMASFTWQSRHHYLAITTPVTCLTITTPVTWPLRKTSQS